MADAKLDVEVVSVEQKVWTGEATFIRARTVDGDIGILPGHWDHLSVLVPGGVVDIRHDETTRRSRPCTAGSCWSTTTWCASSPRRRSSATEIDVARARASLDRAPGLDDDARTTRCGGSARRPALLASR